MTIQSHPSCPIFAETIEIAKNKSSLKNLGNQCKTIKLTLEKPEDNHWNMQHSLFAMFFPCGAKKHKPPHGSSLYTSQCKGASRTLAPAQKGWEGAGSNAPQDKPNHKNHFSSGLRWRYFACKYPRYFQWGLWLRHAPQTLFAIFWCSTYQCKWLQNARVVVPLLGWGKLRIGARKGGYITCHLEEQLWIPDHLITKHMMLAWMSIISSCSYKVSSSCFKPCFLSRHRPFLACWHDWCQSSLQLPAMHWQSASKHHKIYHRSSKETGISLNSSVALAPLAALALVSRSFSESCWQRIAAPKEPSPTSLNSKSLSRAHLIQVAYFTS